MTRFSFFVGYKHSLRLGLGLAKLKKKRKGIKRKAQIFLLYPLSFNLLFFLLPVCLFSWILFLSLYSLLKLIVQFLHSKTEPTNKSWHPPSLSSTIQAPILSPQEIVKLSPQCYVLGSAVPNVFGEIAVDIPEVLLVTQGLQKQGVNETVTDLRKFQAISNISQMLHKM